MDSTTSLAIIGALVVVIVGLVVYIFYKRGGSASTVIEHAGEQTLLEAAAAEPKGGSSFLSNLEWRRAVKNFAPGEVDYTDIKLAIQNAPSSFGLQPYKVVIVTDPVLKEQLRPVSFDQRQVEECAALFVFCARTDVDARAEEYLKATGAEGIRGMLSGFLAGLPDKTAWAKSQAYIALGFGLAAAAEKQIASCPMEGFQPAEVAKILRLDETLVPCCFLAVGKKADGEETYPRFRFDPSDLFLLY